MSFAVTLGGPATEQPDPLAGSGPFSHAHTAHL